MTIADRQSWYLYYVGNSGLGPFNFAISAWQNLLYLAGTDPATGAACGDGGESFEPCTARVVAQQS